MTQANPDRRVLWLVLALLGLPALLAAADAGWLRLQKRNNLTIESSGVARQALVYVPESYDRNRPAPLVLSLHGGAGWPTQQRDLSGWNHLADEHGFLVAYPAGLDVGGMTGWRAMRPDAALERDVLFISDLIDTLSSRYQVDPARIYVNGMSNGGGMSFVLSCTLHERFAAVGMVGAAYMLPWDWCPDPRPMPMISFHGTGDTAAPYAGGATWVSPDILPSIPEWTASWARRNRCRPDAVDIAVADDVDLRTYTGCAEGADVALYTAYGAGHTWPGSRPLPEWFLGPTSRSVDATAEMWAFFQRHKQTPGGAL